MKCEIMKWLIVKWNTMYITRQIYSGADVLAIILLESGLEADP